MKLDEIEESVISNEIEDLLYDISIEDREELANDVMERVNNLVNWISSAKIKLEKYRDRVNRASTLLNTLV